MKISLRVNYFLKMFVKHFDYKKQQAFRLATETNNTQILYLMRLHTKTTTKDSLKHW